MVKLMAGSGTAQSQARENRASLCLFAYMWYSAADFHVLKRELWGK